MHRLVLKADSVTGSTRFATLDTQPNDYQNLQVHGTRNYFLQKKVVQSIQVKIVHMLA